MPEPGKHSVFGPPGRRIVNLAASPNGRFLAFQHVPHDYSTADYHWLFYRAEGDTFVEAGQLPGSLGLAPLDDGHCLALESDRGLVELVRYAPTPKGMAEATARWNVWGALSFNDAILRLMPSGREALVLVEDQDDKQVDWGGGPPPDYIQTWLLIDLTTGQTLQRATWMNLGEPTLSRDAYAGSRGLSVLVALGAPSWVGTRDWRECETLQRIIQPIAYTGLESAIRTGPTRLLTSRRVIEIASGARLLHIERDPNLRFEADPRFHDLSPDENYVLSTVEGGHFALWNVSYQSAWQPELPEHGGVHRAIFLPGGRAALGTKLGGVIVVDCTPGLAPGDMPW